MTGEITLSGLVLPVGGIREKALAARRHGIKTLHPAGAQRSRISTSFRLKCAKSMHFVPVTTLEEALKVSLPQRR